MEKEKFPFCEKCESWDTPLCCKIAGKCETLSDEVPYCVHCASDVREENNYGPRD
jgi:hypothetical protein